MDPRKVSVGPVKVELDLPRGLGLAADKLSLSELESGWQLYLDAVFGARDGVANRLRGAVEQSRNFEAAVRVFRSTNSSIGFKERG